MLSLCLGLVHSHAAPFEDVGTTTVEQSSHGDHEHGKIPNHSVASANCLFCIEFGGKLYFSSFGLASHIPVVGGSDFVVLSATYSSVAGQNLFRPPIARV